MKWLRSVQLPGVKTRRMFVTPAVERLLEGAGYRVSEDPFFAEAVEFVKIADIAGAVVHLRELTGCSLEESRLWVDRVKAELEPS